MALLTIRRAASVLALALIAGCGAGRASQHTVVAPVASTSAMSVPWRPLARQPMEADTLYLLDARHEETLAPGNQGGLIAFPDTKTGSPDPWGNTITAVPGRYREGITNIGAPHRGYAWMPAEGLLAPDQFTIELWLKSAVAWRDLPIEVPLSVSDASGTALFRLQVNGGVVAAELAQSQRARATHVRVTSSAAGATPAGSWVELAVTLKNQVMSLYIGGRRVASVRGALPPLEWTDTAAGDGLALLGTGRRPTVDLTLSDLRISRFARSPGQRVSLAVAPVNVAVNNPTPETVERNLLGVLKNVGTGRDPRLVAPSVAVVRTGNMLTVTPIKAGGPDSAHPSLGKSGKFSYNWRPVDRDLRYIASLHATPYVSISATPSLLGGSVPPSPGAVLQAGAIQVRMPFAREPPNDLNAYAAMFEDLVYHIVVQDHVSVAGWGVWNEPNTLPFWAGTFDQYVQLYAAVARAVKKADPSALVGGPETTTEPQWIPAFMQAVAQQHLPLDFISFHYYTGSVGTLDSVRALVDRLAQQYGIPSPPLIVGEWNWSLRGRPLTGVKPFSELNYYANDWGAAFDAASLIAMQRDRVLDGVLAGELLPKNPSVWTLATPTTARAPLNVYRMWNMLGGHVIPTNGPMPAGVSMIATRDARGGAEVLITHMRYRPDRAEPLILHFRGVPSSATVNLYEIDRQHSDSVDAGPAHAGLERVAAPPLRGGSLSLTLPARSVMLVVLRP